MNNTFPLSSTTRLLHSVAFSLLLIFLCISLGKAQATELPILKFPKDRSQQLEALSKMQQTCKRWQRWYKREKTEKARVNMNLACQNAVKFAKNELGISIDAPSYADARTKKPRKAKPKATLLSARKVSPAYQGKARCDYWEAQIDKIQQKLRGGYKEPQGNKLRQKRRNYWRLIRDNC